MSTLIVNELFVSIQGESSWSGSPCFFIRLAGCNLSCRYCDTPNARQPDQGASMPISNIVQACRDRFTPLITVTGGEPLAQKNCSELITALLTLPDRKVMIETNGSFDIRMIPPGAIAVMDIKCPGSDESNAMDWGNLQRLRSDDEIKFVICDQADYQYALDLIRRHNMAETGHRILFSPAAGKLPPERLASWLIADRPPVQLQLQLHRLLAIR